MNRAKPAKIIDRKLQAVVNPVSRRVVGHISTSATGILPGNRPPSAVNRLSVGTTVRIEALASAIEENRPGVHCTFLLLDEADGGRLFTIASPSLPASFSDSIDGTAIGPHVGSCGRAAFARHDVVTEDIATDPDWAEWRALALDHGLRACWSVPVIAPDDDGEPGKVLGTFATYFEANRGPDDGERRDVERTTALATIVLTRHSDEGELRRANLRDPLTGLANRRLFIDELGAALRGRRVARSLRALYARRRAVRIGPDLSHRRTIVNEVLRTLTLEPGQHDLLGVLNDNIADGRDVSWIWDADFELLAGRVRRVTCAGARAAELALRLKYAGIASDRLDVVPHLPTALDQALLWAPPGTEVYALPTYTALLELRAELARRGLVGQFYEPEPV